MKLMKSLALGVFVLMVTSGINAQTIVGSAHDFSDDSWNTTGQICLVCHTPHNADVTIANAPLWNHESTVATYQTYTSATMDATTGQPDASSKLCLSCHDGTVAVDNFGDQTSGTHFITGGAVSGRWWAGANHEVEEGFLMIYVNGDDFCWEYVDFGWEVD